jgi:hypothetical protein
MTGRSGDNGRPAHVGESTREDPPLVEGRVAGTEDFYDELDIARVKKGCIWRSLAGSIE